MSIPNVLYHSRSFVQNFRYFNWKTKPCHYYTSFDCESRYKRTSFHTNSWSHSDQCLKKTTTSGSRHRSLLPVPCTAAISESGDEDCKKALLTVLKLYTAIRNRNIRELSDIVCDECRCVCNFFSFFQPLHGKQQVLDLFICMIKILGNNIDLVVQPTFSDGMNVGVSWKLEWNKTNVTLGKGFSFHICHEYQGKVLIRNVEMFMEPVLHIEPIRLKIMEFLTRMIEKITLFNFPKEKMRRKLLFVLCFITVTVLISFWICEKM